jgi:hypothetical protein
VLECLFLLLTVDIKQQQFVVAMLTLVRKQSAAHLPIGHSFIPYDILVTVMDSFSNDRELTVKALFATLPYSDMGLRYHFRKLVDSGWIELHAVSGDARVKQIKPTDKLSKQFALLSGILATQLGTPQIHATNA